MVPFEYTRDNIVYAVLMRCVKHHEIGKKMPNAVGIALVTSLISIALSSSLLPVIIYTKSSNRDILLDLRKSEVSMRERMDRFDERMQLPAAAIGP